MMRALLLLPLAACTWDPPNPCGVGWELEDTTGAVDVAEFCDIVTTVWPEAPGVETQPGGDVGDMAVWVESRETLPKSQWCVMIWPIAYIPYDLAEDGCLSDTCLVYEAMKWRIAAEHPDWYTRWTGDQDRSEAEYWDRAREIQIEMREKWCE